MLLISIFVCINACHRLNGCMHINLCSCLYIYIYIYIQACIVFVCVYLCASANVLARMHK